MLTAVTRTCPDCSVEQIFMPVDEDCRDYCEFCCTVCGAAIMIDPAFDYSAAAARHVA